MKEKSNCTFLLFIIIIIALILRVYKINTCGLFLHDEGAFLLVVKTPYEAIKYILSHKDFNIKELADFLSKEGGIVSIDAKPGYFLLFLFLSFFTNLEDYTGKLLSAIFGVLSIIFLYKLIKRLYSANLGLLSAFILSILPAHLFYSRITLANEVASFFSILGFYFYTKDKKLKYIVFSGLSAGYGFTCHYYTFYHLLLIIIYEVVFFKRLQFKRIICFFISFLVFPILFEIPTLIIASYLKSLPYIHQYNILIMSYSQQLLFQFFKRLHAEPMYSFLLFPKLFIYLNGMILFFIFISGFIYLLIITTKYKKSNDVFILLWFLFPFILWNIFKYHVGRNFVVVYPTVAVISSLFIYKLLIYIPKNTLKIFIFLIILISALNNSYFKVISLTSGYKELIKYLKNKGNISHISTQDPVSQFYIGMDNSSYPKAKTQEELFGYAKSRKFSWLATDFMKYSKRYKIVLEIEEKLKPVKIFDNPSGAHLAILYEVYPEKTLKNIIYKEDLSKIKLYKLF